MTEEIITNKIELNNKDDISIKLDNKNEGKTVTIDDNDNNIKISEKDKIPDRNKHTLIINSQLKLVEIKTPAAGFLFRLINENRFSMNEQIPYFQRIQGINDVVEFINDKNVEVKETDYVSNILNSKNPYKGRTNSNNRNKEPENLVEKNFLYFINYEKVPVGVIGLSKIDWYNRIGELHFWTAERFQKRGFMDQALPKMLDFLFYNIRLNRIIVKIRPTNNPGKMILKKFGFVLEGIERQSFFYIPDNDLSKDGDDTKSKIESIRRHRKNRTGRGNEGIYYDL